MTAAAGQTDLVAFTLACAMAFLAGATDVCGVYRLHTLFVSFMSGNTTMLALAIGHGQVTRIGTVAELIASFVLGAIVGTIIAVWSGHRHLSTVVFVVAVLLVAASIWPVATIPALAFAMGMLNAAMQRAGKTGVALTYVTGALVKFATGLGHAICGQPIDDRSWLLQSALWLALFTGAAVSSLTLLHWPTGNTLRALAGFAFLVAAVAAFRPDTQRPDPVPGETEEAAR